MPASKHYLTPHPHSKKIRFVAFIFSLCAVRIKQHPNSADWIWALRKDFHISDWKRSENIRLKYEIWHVTSVVLCCVFSFPDNIITLFHNKNDNEPLSILFAKLLVVKTTFHLVNPQTLNGCSVYKTENNVYS